MNTMYEKFELGAALFFDWPLWVAKTVIILTGGISILSLLQLNSLLSSILSVLTPSPTATSNGKTKTPISFNWFQMQYLTVYLVIMLADWLQGTNMYTLYSSYGVNVGFLFLTGFLTSAIVGGFIGSYVDTYGRKFGCVVFCLLEIIINVMEHMPNIQILFIGRILGGISTNLLFSAFEAWMVAEHRKLKFDENSLMSTFAIASWGNGVMAIAAGFIAQYSVSNLGQGDIGPFQVAIALTVLCLVLILLWWDENYGSPETTEEVLQSMEPSVACTVSKAIDEDISFRNSLNASQPMSPVTPSKKSRSGSRSRAGTPKSVRPETPTRRSSRIKKSVLVGKTDTDVVSPLAVRRRSTKITLTSDSSDSKSNPNPNPNTSVSHAVTTAEESIWVILQRHPEIWLLGLSQACFEGAVYSFVFMWVPTLISIYPAYMEHLTATTPNAELLNDTINALSTSLPTGLVFSCFMLSMTFGGMLFSVMFGGGSDTKNPLVNAQTLNYCNVLIYILSALSMAVPVYYTENFEIVFPCFLVLEGMVGMFNASSGSLRSIYYIESHQSSIISIFRIPLNLLVVFGTLLTSNSGITTQVVLTALSGLHILATVLQLGLCYITHLKLYLHESDKQQ